MSVLLLVLVLGIGASMSISVSTNAKDLHEYLVRLGGQLQRLQVTVELHVPGGLPAPQDATFGRAAVTFECPLEPLHCLVCWLSNRVFLAICCLEVLQASKDIDMQVSDKLFLCVERDKLMRQVRTSVVACRCL